MRTLPATTSDRIHEINSNRVPLWLYSVRARYGGETIYIVNHDESVTVGGVDYQPYPVAFSELTSTVESDTGETEMRVSNVKRELYTILMNDGFRDQNVEARFVWSDDLSNSTLIWTARITEADVTADEVRFALRSEPVFAEPFPARRFQSVCSFRYRDSRCGYEDATAGSFALPECDHTLDGPNGCIVHGASYTSNSETPIHPKRFGGFTNVPRRRT